MIFYFYGLYMFELFKFWTFKRWSGFGGSTPYFVIIRKLDVGTNFIDATCSKCSKIIQNLASKPSGFRLSFTLPLKPRDARLSRNLQKKVAENFANMFEVRSSNRFEIRKLNLMIEVRYLQKRVRSWKT